MDQNVMFPPAHGLYFYVELVRTIPNFRYHFSKLENGLFWDQYVSFSEKLLHAIIPDIEQKF